MNRFIVFIVLVIATLTGAIYVSDGESVLSTDFDSFLETDTSNNKLSNDTRTNERQNEWENDWQSETGIDDPIEHGEDHIDSPTQASIPNKENIYDYIRAGNIEALKQLINESDEFTANMDYRETRPLIVAVRVGNTGIVNMLLDAGADPNLPSAAVNYTPLEAAFDISDKEKSESTIYELVTLLLMYGADPNTLFMNEKTALQVAQEMGLPAVVELLTSHGAEVSPIETSLHEPKVFDTYEKRGELADFTKLVQIGDSEAIVRDYVGEGTVNWEDDRFTVYGPFPSKFITQDGIVKAVSWGRVELFDIPLPGNDHYKWETSEGVGPYDTYQEVALAYEDYDYQLLYKQGEEDPAYLIVDFDEYLYVFSFYKGMIHTAFRCSPEMLEIDMIKNTLFTFDKLEEQPF